MDKIATHPVSTEGWNGKIWYEDQHPFLFVLLALVFFFTGAVKWGVDVRG